MGALSWRGARYRISAVSSKAIGANPATSTEIPASRWSRVTGGPHVRAMLTNQSGSNTGKTPAASTMAQSNRQEVRDYKGRGRGHRAQRCVVPEKHKLGVGMGRDSSKTEEMQRP